MCHHVPLSIDVLGEVERLHGGDWRARRLGRSLARARRLRARTAEGVEKDAEDEADDRARRAFRLHRCARSVSSDAFACDDSRIWPIRFSEERSGDRRARDGFYPSRRHTANRRDVVFEGDVDVDVDVDALDALDARRVQASRDAVAAQSRDAESDARVGRGVGVERARGGGAEG